jgi:phospholipid/cholesterol/gamma-HCH transport system substrate-binding protein
MAKEHVNSAKLGLFVTAALILFTITVYYIGSKQHLFTTDLSVSATFHNVKGLQKGNNVRYSGINVGTVRKIIILNDTTIQVDMQLEQRMTTVLHKNAVASIGSDGLVGNMIININPGKGKDQLVSDGDFILSYSKAETEDMLRSLSSTSENIALLTLNLLEITENINSGQGAIATMINDPVLAQNFRESIQNLNKATQEIVQGSSQFNDQLSGINSGQGVLGYLFQDSTFEMQVNQITTGIDSLINQRSQPIMDNLEKSSSDIANSSTALRQLLEDIRLDEGIAGTLLKDSLAAVQLQKTIENLEQGTDRFNENMEALKHNFLFRRYFKKQAKKQKKALEKAQDSSLVHR